MNNNIYMKIKDWIFKIFFPIKHAQIETLKVNNQILEKDKIISSKVIGARLKACNSINNSIMTDDTDTNDLDKVIGASLEIIRKENATIESTLLGVLLLGGAIYCKQKINESKENNKRFTEINLN